MLKQNSNDRFIEDVSFCFSIIYTFILFYMNTYLNFNHT